MLSFVVIIWCCHLFYVIIWCYHFSQFANVVIFVLSYFLVHEGCYNLCYHLMLSFLLSFPPFFLFAENMTHSYRRWPCLSNLPEKYCRRQCSNPQPLNLTQRHSMFCWQQKSNDIKKFCYLCSIANMQKIKS